MSAPVADFLVAAHQSFPRVPRALGGADGPDVPGFDMQLDPVKPGHRPCEIGQRGQSICCVAVTTFARRDE